MKIAAHHIEGTPEHKLSSLLRLAPSYQPVCAWPDDCTVQWGNGIIPRTPFFEAFPPGTFIRGEGESIEAAERKAFAQYQREFECAHIWGRQRPGRDLYLNGAGWCRKCGAFRGRMFPEIVVLGHWRQPLVRWEVEHLIDLETDLEMNAHMDRKFPEDASRRKKAARVLRIRMNLFGEAA